MRSLRSLLACCALLAAPSLLGACAGDDAATSSSDPAAAGSGGVGDRAGGAGGSGGRTQQSEEDDAERTHPQGWFGANTVAHRVDLPNAARGTSLNAEQLALQLAGYDPGSLLRCAVADDAAYRAAVDALGGVTWGYGVFVLEDLSKPRFHAGLQRYQAAVPTAGATDAAGGAVEIVKPDIVAVAEDAALFYSSSHGLMLVDLAGSEPAFACATPLPGVVDQFFFHEGHLVAMVKQQPRAGSQSYLLHFSVDGTAIRFVEAVALGAVNILDSRRFNDRLVFYTDLRLQPEPAQPVQPAPGGPAFGAVPVNPVDNATHRSLRVFALGERLTEELHDTLIDTTVAADQLVQTGVAAEAQVGDVVHESRQFGHDMWASDHYFAVTESITQARFDGWQTQVYSVCTESHVVETSYEHCTTIYETRPNPDYTPPDNSSGDRACKNTTLADCLRQVARVSNETIQVPVGRECTDRIRQQWICNRYEQRTTQYPTFSYDQVTQLFIYEYTPDGFVRLDTSVREIANTGLDALGLDDSVPVLTTTTDTFDLEVPGAVQTLHFQNGILYVISKGVLQVYTLSGASLVRTATLPVVNDSLQSSLFTEDRLFLSDFGWANAMDMSTLRVVDLSNPAFPRVEGSTHSLPGGHSAIIASLHGIFTIGAVTRFENQTINALKLGLFGEPYAEEQAYLILATDLEHTWLGDLEGYYWSGAHQRLLLPYMGQDAVGRQEHRVSASRVIPGEIVSEGALLLPEAVQRVRPVDAAQQSFLTFAQNSIAWLTPQDEGWQAAPVLEYFQPVALLRLNEQDDYAEVQRLGDRCKVRLANASDINQRENSRLSREFECVGAGIRAYGRTLLTQTTAVEFDADAELRELAGDEVNDIEYAITQRQTCLLSLELVDSLAIDYDEDYEQSDFTCVGPAELQRLTEEANRTGPARP